MIALEWVPLNLIRKLNLFSWKFQNLLKNWKASKKHKIVEVLWPIKYVIKMLENVNLQNNGKLFSWKHLE